MASETKMTTLLFAMVKRWLLWCSSKAPETVPLMVKLLLFYIKVLTVEIRI